MLTAPTPADEIARQAAVDALGLLDTDVDVAFSELAELAAFVAHTPIAAVSLIDNDRQWFKSILGVNTDQLLGRGVKETPRGISFCQHTIHTETLVVADTSRDDRFVDSPFVVGPPHVRFYAGVSLVSEGHNIGTLCVMDTRPRTFLSDERHALEILSRQVSNLCSLHRLNRGS